MEQNEKTRYVALDGVRGICAVAVMIYHFTRHSTDLFLNAPVAVDLFFMLSGFVLCASYGQRIEQGKLNFVDLMVKRIVRLYPLFLAGLALGVAGLFILHQMGRSDFSLMRLVACTGTNALMLPYLNGADVHNFVNVNPSPGNIFPGNAALWSLFFEMFANAFLLVLCVRSPTVLLKMALLFLFLLIALGFLTAIGSYKLGIDSEGGFTSMNFIIGFPRVMFGFCLGIMAFKIISRTKAAAERYRSIARRMSFVAKNPYVLYAFLLLLLAVGNELLGFTYILSITIACPLILFVGAEMTKLSWFTDRLSTFLGWISYPLYCLHVPIGNLVAAWMLKHPNQLPLPFSVVASAASLTVAILVGILFDEPVRAWLGKVISNKRRKDELRRISRLPVA